LDSTLSIYIIRPETERLGIEAEVTPKTGRILSECATAMVARGTAEIGGVPGAELVGPLPDEVRQVTVFSAGVLTNARQPEAAAELIRFLASARRRQVRRVDGPRPHHAALNV
jgi:molybdate transport system substrate-binding protein